MNDFYVGWNFGDEGGANRGVWDETPEYSRITQQLIQDVLPMGYKPYGANDAAGFSIIKEKVIWLMQYNELDSEKDWLTEYIRYSLLDDYEPDFNILFSNEPTSIRIMKRRKEKTWKEKIKNRKKEGGTLRFQDLLFDTTF